MLRIYCARVCVWVCLCLCVCGKVGEGLCLYVDVHDAYQHRGQYMEVVSRIDWIRDSYSV